MNSHARSFLVGLLLIAVGFAGGWLSATSLRAQGKEAEQLATSGLLSGRVAEVIQTKSFTYVRFEAGQWAAVPSADLQVGEEAKVDVQQMMENFQSPSLGRVFERIAFGTLSGEARNVPMLAPKGVGNVLAKLQTAPSADGQTVAIAEVFQRRADLKGRQVKVRGQVDRVNVVQGVAYVHLKDGTGSAAEGTDDLLCISEKELLKGATVTLEGTVVVDKDVGMGSKPVVLEQAKAL